MQVLLKISHKNIAKQHAGKILQSYDTVLKGFAIYLPDTAGTAFIEAMKRTLKFFQ